MIFCGLLIFFKINFFKKCLCQRIWIQIRPDVLLNVRPDLDSNCLQRLLRLQIRGGKGYFSIDFLEFSIEN